MSAKQIYPDPYADNNLLGPVDTIEGRQSWDEKKSIDGSSGAVTKVMGSGPQFDNMADRDPNNLNPHLQIMWDDIVGEPEGLKTPASCWNCSFKCYNCTRTCCYVFLVVLFGPFIAFINGINFACLSFNHVWCAGPCLRLWKIHFSTVKKFWETCLLALCAPCAEVFGLYFSKIKVRYQKLPDGNDNTTQDYFTV